MKCKHRYAIKFLTIILILILNGCQSKNSGWKLVINKIMEAEYSGFVTDKYIDKKNHNDPTIILNDTLFNAWDFYGNIQIGDSLSKRKGTTILEIHRNDSIIKLDFEPVLRKRFEDSASR